MGLKNKALIMDGFTKGNIRFSQWWNVPSTDCEKFANSSNLRKIKNRNRKYKLK